MGLGQGTSGADDDIDPGDGQTDSHTLMTRPAVIADLESFLGGYPKVKLKDCRKLLSAISIQLEKLGVRDLDTELVLRAEMKALLSEPLTRNGPLLAAGWLLHMRPAHDLPQAQIDLEGAPLGAANEPGRKVSDGLRSGSEFAYRHVAERCLRRWRQEWADKNPPVPSTLFQPNKGGASPRTRAVASALAEVLDERFNDLSSNPAKLGRRRKVWMGDAPPSAPKPEAHMWTRKIAHLTWASTRRRVITSIVAGIALVGLGAFIVNGVMTGPPPLTRTEVLAYRPSLPEVPPEPTGSRYTDLTCMESDTSPRRDARLCVTVNMGPVLDPCFEINEHYVSCPVPAISEQGRAFYDGDGRIRPVIQNVQRRNYPTERQLSIDAALNESRPWAIALKEPLSGGNRLCLAKYDDILGPLPVKFACVGWEVRYALDIEATINGTDRGATLNFTKDSSVVFDLDQSQPVWTVRAPDGPDGVYREVEVAAAYF